MTAELETQSQNATDSKSNGQISSNQELSSSRNRLRAVKRKPFSVPIAGLDDPIWLKCPDACDYVKLEATAIEDQKMLAIIYCVVDEYGDREFTDDQSSRLEIGSWEWAIFRQVVSAIETFVLLATDLATAKKNYAITLTGHVPSGWLGLSENMT